MSSTSFKPTLREGFEPILQKQVGTKEFKLVYDADGSKRVKNIPVSVEEGSSSRLRMRSF